MDSTAAKILEYSNLSKLELMVKDAKEIKKIAKEIDITATYKNEEGKYTRKSKSTLIDEIIQLCSPSITPTTIDKNEEYPDVELDQNKIVGVIHRKLSNEFCLMFTNNVAFSTEINAIAAELKASIESALIARVGRQKFDDDGNQISGYSVGYLLKWKSEILKKIESAINNEFVNTNVDWKKHYSIFEKCVNASFSNLSAKKREFTNTNIRTRKSESLSIKVTNLIDWANDTLINLPESDSQWREVALSLMIATGRRQSEIMCSASFDFHDDNHVYFSGQLKRHNDEEVESFLIPTLVNANAVIEGLNWLESRGKRESDPKKAHNRFSRYLSEKVKVICSKYIIVDDGDWEYESANGKLVDRKKTHIFRQIYAQVAFKKSGEKGTNKRHFLAGIMGHSDSPSSLNWSADNYDSDVMVID